MEIESGDINDVVDKLFSETEDTVFDDPDGIIDSEPLLINLDEINEQARVEATIITERLSAYYFDEKYLEEHPYIPTKIMNEMNNIRRLLKMLSVNEKAQDSLIRNITCNAGKATLYSSLTSLQSAMLNIQNQLNNLTSNLEQIFSEMQEECDRTYMEKEKDVAEDGSITVKGSKDFIKMLTEQMYKKYTVPTQEKSQEII